MSASTEADPERRPHDAPLLARLADDQGAQAAPNAVDVEAVFVDLVDPAVDGQSGRLAAGAVVREQELGDRLGAADHLLDIAQQRAGLVGGEVAVDDQRVDMGQTAQEPDGFPAARGGMDGEVDLESGPQSLPLDDVLMGDDEMGLGLDRQISRLHRHFLPSALTVECRLSRPPPPLGRFSRLGFHKIQKNT